VPATKKVIWLNGIESLPFNRREGGTPFRRSLWTQVIENKVEEGEKRAIKSVDYAFKTAQDEVTNSLVAPGST